MNRIETPVQYIFSDMEYGNGEIYVSFHNATMDCSAGIKHVTNIYIIMRDEAEMATLGLIADGGQRTLYFVLI